MKILLTLFVLFFSSSVFADDISDFQIEGMSVGDSLLDYLTKNEIEESKSDFYPNSKEYYMKTVYLNSNLYDYFLMHFKINDDKYIMYTIGGIKNFNNKIEDCYPLKNIIVSDILGLFEDIKIVDNKKRKHIGDKTGKSYTTDYEIYFKDNSYITISCYDWSDDLDIVDNLRIAASSKQIYNFLLNEAF